MKVVDRALVLEAYRTLAKFVPKEARDQPPRWPFSVIERHWYLAHFFPKEVYTTIKALKAKGISMKKIAKLCWGPSAVSHWLFIPGSPLSFSIIDDPTLNTFEGLTKEESIEFVEMTIELLLHQRKGDPFCRDGRNVLLSEQDVRSLVNRSFIKAAKIPLTRALRNLTATLWQYTVLIQVGEHTYSHEFHGLYPIEEGRSLFVKDFFNLAPGKDVDEPVWDFSLEIPYSEITILEIYEDLKKQYIDMFNHYDVRGELVEYCVLADGSELSEREIIRLSEICFMVFRKAIKAARTLSKSDWVKKLIDLRYLWLRPHKEILGIDWHPPENIYYLTERTEEAAHVAERFEKNRLEKVSSLVKTLPPDEIVNRLTHLFMRKIYGNTEERV